MRERERKKKNAKAYKIPFILANISQNKQKPLNIYICSFNIYDYSLGCPRKRVMKPV